jgi:CHAD domain-containing protein
MEAQPGADAEIEWQLEAQDLRLVLRWIESTAAEDADGVTISDGPTLNHVDTYLDTEDRRLDRAGYSMRVRRSRRLPPEATLKALNGAGEDALRIRRELAEELDEDEPTAVARAPGAVGERVRALVGSRKLVPLFDLQTRRRVFPLTVAGTPSGELLLDETAIREPDGRILSRLRRVEVEVPETALAAVSPLVESMQRTCGLQPALLSKYEAALVASGRPRLEPESFGPTAIEPCSTIGQAGLAILRRHFTTLRAKEPGTRLGDDIEELHDFRVASRRLRAAVALFGDALPAEAARLRPELAWIGQTVGAVRDLDVQLAQLDEWEAVVAEPDREPLERLRAVLDHERGEARSAMLEALDSPRYERFVRRFGAMLRSRSGTRTGAALAAAPDLVEGRHRALHKAARRIGPAAEPAAYHRMRIAGKRFRYALEFLSDLYPGETKRVVRRTVALQDLLGAYQDADVAIRRLRGMAAERGRELGPATVFAMGEIAERYRSQMDGIRDQVGDAYARLRGRAWKRLLKRMEAERPPIAAGLVAERDSAPA